MREPESAGLIDLHRKALADEPFQRLVLRGRDIPREDVDAAAVLGKLGGDLDRKKEVGVLHELEPAVANVPPVCMSMNSPPVEFFWPAMTGWPRR